MSPEQFEKEMKETFLEKGGYDTEGAHSYADHIMCKALRELGYGAGVEIFEKAEKWYA